jgi:superfamily II DNA/RNA helicase
MRTLNLIDSGTEFSDLGLSEDTLRAVTDAGYTKPTPIQMQAIPCVLMNRDVLGCAQTGTGKTASFVLPMLDILASGRARARMPRSLILEPTRELAAQVAVNFDTYGKYHRLACARLTGGESLDAQRKLLDRGVDVLIATPGRLIDLVERGGILLNDIKILVVDEADRLLDMGFMPDVERIVGMLPRIRQTLFFSATLPPEIRRLADAFLVNPKEISVTPTASAAETVDQGLILIKESDRSEVLRQLIKQENVESAIIFCNRKRDVDMLCRSLKHHGFHAAALHGDMPQSARTETLAAFRRNDIALLVASDVAGRGLDISDLSHVLNYDVPFHAENYIHRIGRTGRAGKTGRAFTLASPDEAKFVRAIEELLGTKIPIITGPGTAPATIAGEETARPKKRRGRGRKPSTHKSPTHKASGSKRLHTHSEPEHTTQLPTPLSGAAARSEERKRTGGRTKTPAASRSTAKASKGMGDHVPAFLTRPPRSGTQ